tara:strand:- start:708 stop:1994 length:1287 start_codon:yes stop_codon:yes gene_type:complete
MINTKDFWFNFIPDPWFNYAADKQGKSPDVSKSLSKHNIIMINVHYLNEKKKNNHLGTYDYWLEVLEDFLPSMEESKQHNYKFVLYNFVETHQVHGVEFLEKACKDKGFNFDNFYFAGNQKENQPIKNQIHVPYEYINRAKKTHLEEIKFFQCYVNECGRRYFDKNWKWEAYEYDSDSVEEPISEDKAKTFKKWLFDIKEDVGDRKYRFLQYNNALAPHRLSMISWAMLNDFDKFFNWSYINTQEDTINHNRYKEQGLYHKRLIENAEKRIIPNIPIWMENDEWAQKFHPFNNNLPNKRHYDTTYCGIYGETNFHCEKPGYSRFTEKSIHGFIMHPSLIMATPGSVSLMRDLGFKSFPQVFDESYDDIEEPSKRFYAITQEVKKICKMPKQELIERVNDCRDNILHNQQVLFNMDINDTFLKFCEQLI